MERVCQTRQLSYHKEDRAQYMGVMKSFESPHYAPG